ncbi:diacylglycerol kinase family lipid kinase [Sporosarcina sp. YIM B06819]|uniref:diacylglycerol/lipid kinase family protein n=1 Tax=Sporosarcina sp. YIM B06819 TaxID=3081769 RepID=UPI00298CDB10|nr:diacylglycerol kinase family lipid kinase [Sporosarcina sp. YIM B06819]
MYVFIVNPDAGKGQAAGLWRETEKILQQQTIDYRVLMSSSETATQSFIAEQQQLYTLKAIAVIGGDGTTSSVIQSIAKTTTALAILPAGSGNDTARMFTLTTQPARFIEQLVAHQTTAIDLLTINGRYGITVAGIGLDATIGQRVNQSWYKPVLNKLGIGSFAYTIAAVIGLLTFQAFTSDVTIDGHTFPMKTTWLIACGNTSSYGGGLVVCPQASPVDDLLNLTLLHDVGRMKILFQFFPALLRGQPILRKGVTYIEGKEVVITSDRPVAAIVDGEIVTSTPLHVAIHEQALTLVLTL